MDRPLYPSTAVVGQERVKQALFCLAVEPRIDGVLLCGEKRTAKSTLMRALDGLEGMHLLELPVNATEDMLLGGVKLKTTIRTGRRTFQPSLLTQADGAVPYADEVNLFPSALTAAPLDAPKAGVCRMEQDGISHTCPAHFALAGTINPEEGTLRPQLLNRFGPYVTVTREREPETRREVVHRRLTFEEAPAAFHARWARREERLAGRLTATHALLPQVDVREAEKQATCLLARQANAAGHRAELAILYTTRALAVLAGRIYINLEDLHAMAKLTLPHRRREGNEGPPPRQEGGEEPPRRSGADGQAGGGDRPTDESHPADELPQGGVQVPVPPAEQGPSRGRSKQGGNLYEVRTLLTTRTDYLTRRSSGRRSKTRSATRRGRAVGDHIPRGKAEDLAMGAALWAVAPCQWSRGGGQSGLVILPPDLRMEVQESHMDADIVFTVDASGSVGAARQMKEVREAVLSMLMDFYQKRDQVGLMAFRGRETTAVLELTRGVELVQRELQALPIGGRTPLAAGLEKARCILGRQCRRVRDSLPLLVFITNGRANFNRGGDPVEETLQAARRMAEAHIPAVMINTERQFISLRLVAQAAQVIGAPCYRAEKLRARPLAQLMRGHSPAAG